MPDHRSTDLWTRIEALFAGPGGRRYLGERVTNATHMLQTAVHAQRWGAPPALVAAALLHDVGYLLAAGDDGDARARPGDAVDVAHPGTGARWLAGWLPPEVSEPVRLHVEAKRYLCATEPGYASRLSPESARTLALQGGVMGAAEAAAFARLTYGADAVLLRRFDEGGKVAAESVPGIRSYRRLVDRLELA